jgi:hypothetical protein
MWGGSIYAEKAAKKVVTALYEAAGAAALYVDCPLERGLTETFTQSGNTSSWCRGGWKTPGARGWGSNQTIRDSSYNAETRRMTMNC